LIREKPLGVAGLAVVLFFVVVAAIAAIAPGVIAYGYNEQDIVNRLRGPSSTHLFGTDQFGRDVFSRVWYGARVTVTVAFSAVLLGVAGATVFGTLSGYLGGWFDTILQRVVDVFMSIPRIVILLVLVSYTRPSIGSVIAVLAISISFSGTRIIRSSVLAVREALYVESVKVIGASHVRVMLRHIVPNVVPLNGQHALSANDFLAEIARRENAAQTKAMERLTWWILALTVVITILTALNAWLVLKS